MKAHEQGKEIGVLFQALQIKKQKYSPSKWSTKISSQEKRIDCFYNLWQLGPIQ